MRGTKLKRKGNEEPAGVLSIRLTCAFTHPCRETISPLPLSRTFSRLNAPQRDECWWEEAAGGAETVIKMYPMLNSFNH